MKVQSTRDVAKLNKTNCIIYGESGIGKTKLVTTAPKPLIIDSESGLLSVADFDLDVVQARSLKDTIEVYNFLANEKHDYETVFVDSLSETAQIVLTEYKAKERDPRQAYQKLGEEVISMVRKFKSLPMHVVFVAKQARLIDEFNGRTSYGPSFPGRMLDAELPYQVDVLLAMRFHKHEGKQYRVLQTGVSIQYNAKDRSGLLDNLEKPDLSSIFEKISAGSIQAELKI